MHFGCVELIEQHGSTRSSRRARHVERVVSRRDMTSQVEFGLNEAGYTSSGSFGHVVPPCNAAGAPVTPPSAEIAVPHFRFVAIVQQRAEAAPELGVDELTAALPREVLVVQLVRLVEPVQVLGEIFGGSKVLDVDVGVRGSGSPIILPPTSHHDRHDIAPTTIR